MFKTLAEAVSLPEIAHGQLESDITDVSRLLWIHKKYDFCWFIATALLARRRWCVMTKMRSSMSKLNRSHYLVEFQTWSSNGEIFDKKRWRWLRGAMGPALPPQPIFCRLSSFFVSSTLFPNLSCCQVCDLLITDKLSSIFPLQFLQRNSLQNFPS